MNKKVFTSVLVIGGLVAVYFLVVKNKKLTKSKAIDLIIQNGYFTSGRSSLESFGEDYLITWGKAAKNNESTFVYNGKIYNTQGGTIKK